MHASAAHGFFDAYNAIAQDWARTQGGRRGILPPVRGVSYRRTWPDAAAELDADLDLGREAANHRNWIDSTLDLRDGLSVIEVFADPDPAQVPSFKLDLSNLPPALR